MNLHPGLLPFNKGAYPNVWTIVDRTPAGATLHHIDSYFDTGDIVAQAETSVDATDTGEELYRKLEDLSIQLFKDSWPAIKSGAVGRRPQLGVGTLHKKADVAAIDRIDPNAMYQSPGSHRHPPRAHLPSPSWGLPRPPRPAHIHAPTTGRGPVLGHLQMRFAVITARGGSKRIPRKNIRSFCGQPIIAYSIRAAHEAGCFDEVMVSTDDAEIAEVAQAHGAKVPFLRSADASGNHATTAFVMIEVLEDYARRGRHPSSYVVSTRQLHSSGVICSSAACRC